VEDKEKKSLMWLPARVVQETWATPRTVGPEEADGLSSKKQPGKTETEKRLSLVAWQHGREIEQRPCGNNVAWEKGGT